MRRPALYSSSSHPLPAPDGPAPAGLESTAPSAPPLPSSPRFHRVTRTHLAGLVLALVLGLLALSLWTLQRPAAPRLTQDDIDAAVLHTLETKVLPSPTARAVDKIAPSVVRVVGYSKAKPVSDKDKSKGLGKNTPHPDKDADKNKGEEVEYGVGTGVVIVDTGVILTNLHVVAGADTIRVIFADGTESTASVTGLRPEHDLAVLQAHKIPDDLVAATMRSTADLRPGDQVVAVGFPFGIGPSASAGIVSGLKREFESPEGKRPLTNLIQFDAAANPGNSGGPQVTMDGELVGIVTAILNPTRQRTFIGIGFAVPIENAASAAGMPPF